MEVTSFINRSQIVLVLGLLFLLGGAAVSIFGVMKLEAALEEKQRGTVAQDSYDELSKRVKDLQITASISRMDRTGATDEKRELAKKNLEVAIEKVDRTVEGRYPQAELFANIRKELFLLNESTGPPSSQSISRIEAALEDLNKAEFSNIDVHTKSLLTNANEQLAISVLSILVAVLLIGLALLARAKQERADAKMIQNLNNLKNEAESANRLKSKFLSTVSHEIRTPLNGIIGLSDLLAVSPPTFNQQPLAQMIQQSGKTLLRIINDILDFSKIEAGKFELSVADCSIPEIANQVLFTLSPKAAEKSINLNCELDPEIPKIVTGDADRISQVLFNLVGNAIKFTSVGSVILRIKAMKSESGIFRIHFSVDDTGVGIPERDLGNLFLPFMQIRPGGTSGEVGTGLGLSISQSIVSAMGGKIQVRSDEGRGSQFSFAIPFEKFSKEKIDPNFSFRLSKAIERQNTVEPLSRPGFRPRVLVVEDNPTNQVVAHSMLQRLDVDFMTASDGREALDLIRTNSFDLILMDCQMPIMDGFEVTRHLRKNHSQLPIIAMTANAYGEDEQKCLDAGMNGFLSKPISIDRLREVLAANLPKDRGFSRDAINQLDSAVGVDARKRVIRAFLTTAKIFRDTLRSDLSQQNVTGLNKLGHRFKSSSRSVGGIEFGDLCANLERVANCDEAQEIEIPLLNALTKLETSLESLT